MKQVIKERLHQVSQLAETRFEALKRETLEKYADAKERHADLLEQAARWIETHDTHDIRSRGEKLMRDARSKAREIRAKLS